MQCRYFQSDVNTNFILEHYAEQNDILSFKWGHANNVDSNGNEGSEHCRKTNIFRGFFQHKVKSH